MEPCLLKLPLALPLLNLIGLHYWQAGLVDFVMCFDTGVPPGPTLKVRDSRREGGCSLTELLYLCGSQPMTKGDKIVLKRFDYLWVNHNSTIEGRVFPFQAQIKEFLLSDLDWLKPYPLIVVIDRSIDDPSEDFLELIEL